MGGWGRGVKVSWWERKRIMKKRERVDWLREVGEWRRQQMKGELERSRYERKRGAGWKKDREGMGGKWESEGQGGKGGEMRLRVEIRFSSEEFSGSPK